MAGAASMTERPYVPAIVAEGRFVFVSGQIPIRDGQIVHGDIAEQTRTVMANIASILESAGATLADVVRCGVFLTDLDRLPEFNDAYTAAFQTRLPTRTAVGAVLHGYDVEIDCIAVLPGSR